MKSSVLILLCLPAIFFSCNKHNNNLTVQEAALVGSWKLRNSDTLQFNPGYDSIIGHTTMTVDSCQEELTMVLLPDEREVEYRGCVAPSFLQLTDERYNSWTNYIPGILEVDYNIVAPDGPQTIAMDTIQLLTPDSLIISRKIFPTGPYQEQVRTALPLLVHSVFTR